MAKYSFEIYVQKRTIHLKKKKNQLSVKRVFVEINTRASKMAQGTKSLAMQTSGCESDYHSSQRKKKTTS